MFLQEDVDEFMKQPERDSAESVLRSLEEQHNKYKFMEYNLITKKSRWAFHCCPRRIFVLEHYPPKTWHDSKCCQTYESTLRPRLL